MISTSYLQVFMLGKVVIIGEMKENVRTSPSNKDSKVSAVGAER